MLRVFAIIFGIVLAVVGILGFLPNFVVGGKLFDLFPVNQEHNMAHLVTGIFGLLCGLSSGMAAKVFFIVVGILYGLLSVLAFTSSEPMIFAMFANNLADNLLHGGIAVLCLYLGLAFKG
jgi:hypothetical protein